MLNAALRRLGLRGRPTRSRTVPTRRSARPTLELLEARDVPASPTMIREPFAPFGEAKVLASLPQNPSHSHYLTYAIDNNAAGDVETAWINAPMPATGPQPEIGLYHTPMTRFGVVGAPVFLEGYDFDKSNHYTSGLTGDVDVGVGPNGHFSIAYGWTETYWPDPFGPAEWGRHTVKVRSFAPNGTPVGGPTVVAEVVDGDLYDNTHYALQFPKIGVDALGGYTVAWFNVTTVDPVYQSPGSVAIGLDVSRGGALPLRIASSFLNKGNGSFSQWSGDQIISPDLATNGLGHSVVVWARLIKPTTYYYSGYLQLDAVYAQRIDAAGAMPEPRRTVSQNADTYAPTPTPRVAVNDANSFVVYWAYMPPPPSQATAPKGLYARMYDAVGPVGNEFLVLASPYTVPSYPSPIQYHLGHTNHPVGMDADGNVVFAWFESASYPTFIRRLRVKMYTWPGNPYKDPITIDETPYSFGDAGVGPEQIQIAVDHDGDFEVAYGNKDPLEGRSHSILGRRYVRHDFEVQNGEIQRDTVQFLSVEFNPNTVDLLGLVAAGNRLELMRYALTGTGPGTPVSLSGVVSVVGSSLIFDFGPGGLENGYYVLKIDLDGDGNKRAVDRFYAMDGDMTGTGLINYPGLDPGMILND